jgi:hypothetical protein
MSAVVVYGAPEIGPFRVMQVGADDATTHGAVTWVAYMLGLVDENESYPAPFDTALAKAVGRFQREHGLPVTTVMDEATYRALGYTGQVLAKDAKVGGGEYLAAPPHLRDRFSAWSKEPMFWVVSTATFALVGYASFRAYRHFRAARN